MDGTTVDILLGYHRLRILGLSKKMTSLGPDNMATQICTSVSAVPGPGFSFSKHLFTAAL